MLLLMQCTLIFLFYFILKILIAVTDCTTVLSSIHISLYNLPSHIIVAFHLEDGMVIAFCRAAWSLLGQPVCRAVQRPRAGVGARGRPGHRLRGNGKLLWGQRARENQIRKPGRFGQETVKRPLDAWSCQDHHNARTKIRQMCSNQSPSE